MPKTIANQLQEYMEIKNLTQSALAYVLGTHPSQISRWVHEKNQVSPAWRMIIAAKLNGK